MINRTLHIFGLLGICAGLCVAAPQSTKAAQQTAVDAGVRTSASFAVKVDAPDAAVRSTCSKSGVQIGSAEQGQVYDVLEATNDGWVKIDTGSLVGYIEVANQATIVEKTKEQVDENLLLRKKVVDYAMQFVGGPYVYGGNDPHTGVDCSGFTKYVMQHAAGIALNRSSSSQSSQGRPVTREQAKPGDLIFYGNGSRINHVAVYIGNGQIVHASTEKTGIKISSWDHRKQVKIMSILG